MNDPTALLKRLDEIGQALERTGGALALIGLGSVGTERDRMDSYSDLDFFVIVQAGQKSRFLNNLGWLSAPCPLAYTFLNTADGYKALYEDGIFAEFAIFEPEELDHIPFAAGQIVWQSPDAPDNLSAPRYVPPTPESHPAEWLIGEALTNLYVGLGRYWRGEKLSAMRFVQGYAVDRVLELIETLETPQPGHQDRFVRERRFEQRYPLLAQHLPTFTQGYDATPASARAVLEFLSEHFEVNPTMAGLILSLCLPRE
jgi:hypothetical protein